MAENNEGKFTPSEGNGPRIEIIPVELPTMDVWYASTPKHPDAQDVSPDNEDTIIVNKKTGLIVIADGMGSHKNGKEASTLAATGVDILVSAQRKEQTLHINLDRLNSPPNPDSETTLTALLFHAQDNNAEILHVGDSRIYVIRKIDQDYQLQLLTPDISIAYSDHPVFEPWATHLLSSLNPYTPEMDQQYATALVDIKQKVIDYNSGKSTLAEVIQTINPDSASRWIDQKLIQQELSRKPLPEYPLPYQDCWLSKNRTAGFYSNRNHLHHHTVPIGDSIIGFLAVTDGISDVFSHESLRKLIEQEMQVTERTQLQHGEYIVRTLMEQANELRETVKNDDQTVALAFIKR